MKTRTAFILLALVTLGGLGVGPSQVAAQGRPTPLVAPSGTYSIGRRHFEWTDWSRADAENHSGRGEIIVWVWYPAAPAKGAQPAEWMPDKWADVLWSDFAHRVGSVATVGANPAASIRAHAYADASSYPVLVLAPGLGATPLEYTSVIEDVVSHGYIVVGVVSTYVSRATVFSDGRVVEGRDPMAAPIVRGSAPPTTEQGLERFALAVELVAGDISFALNQLALLDADASSPMKGRLDLSRIGVIGHSLGGASVVQAGRDDARIRAVFDIDGSPVWNAGKGPLGKPLIMLSAGATMVGYGSLLDGATPGRHLRLSGTAHTFSTDIRLMPFLSPPASPSSNQLDPARALAVTAAYVVAFFDTYLNGHGSPLLDGPSRAYPEIHFESPAP